MPIKIPIPSVSSASKRVKGKLWKGIREASSPEGLLIWIRENMTGDQLIPNWGEHKQEIWFDQQGAIESSSETDRKHHLREYLKGIYAFWIKQNGTRWNKNDIEKRIDEIFAKDSMEIFTATWPATLSIDQKQANEIAKRAGRYALLAEDYYNHINKTGSYFLLKTRSVSISQFLAIAIYSSAQFSQILGIARGHNRGAQQGVGKAQDFWFLVYAASGIKKIAKIASLWYGNITDLPSGIPNAPESGPECGYLRRDMDCSESMIEEMFDFSEYTEKKGDFLNLKEGVTPKIFVDKGMMSTTYETKGAAPYCTNSNVTLLIQIDKTAVGKYDAIPLEKISRLPMEKEILWAPETRFQVIAIRDNRLPGNAETDKANWRNPTRDWSETQKLWIYLKAPRNDEQVNIHTYGVSQALRQLAKIDILAYFIELLGWDENLYKVERDKLTDDQEKKKFISAKKDYFIKENLRKGKVMSLVCKGFPGQPDAIKHDLPTLNKQLAQMFSEWVSSFRKSLPNTYTDENIRLAIAIYSSPVYGWIMANLSSDIGSRDLVNWVNSIVLSAFQSYSASLKTEKITYYKFDVNSGIDRINEIKLLKKEGQVIVSDIGVIDRRRKPYSGSDNSQKIIWVIDLKNIPDTDFVLLRLSQDQLLLKPYTRFEVTEIKESNVNWPVEVWLSYIAPQTTKTA